VFPHIIAEIRAVLLGSQEANAEIIENISREQLVVESSRESCMQLEARSVTSGSTCECGAQIAQSIQ
jgi:hypothetical protein